MDVAYNQHSPYSRHHSHSYTNLGQLTLAPLTSRLPLSDPDALPESNHVSYVEGRSAPTTPSILSRSSSRVSLRKSMNLALPRSNSSAHLVNGRKQPRSGATTPGGTRLKNELNLSTISSSDKNDSDWLLRAGAAISSSTRESKGQAWLVSRASSTSLTGQGNEDDEELERELAKERERASRYTSRRGSTVTFDGDDELSPVTTRRSLSFGPATGAESRPTSRMGSRANSRRGSKAHLFTPIDGERDGYFDQGDYIHQDFVTEPDFVDAEDEEIYENENEAKKDDAEVRNLARSSNLGLGRWVEKMFGWSLFAVEEDGEDDEIMDEKAEDSEITVRSRRTLDSVADPVTEEVPPPLRDGDVGGWQDAAWLLSVATKVLL
ncbi:uncharacterized protein RAG0_01584 [Rhynchosporium agropyri]|uniref:DUF3984 domain protein n=1 Tax=Rhynchosporium agropyri TaxID=914238 RepID=A0A1E1JXG0_9HELO|nr:uncharacterized protein RAG0_01584 [Rhynchosporium agropyri]